MGQNAEKRGRAARHLARAQDDSGCARRTWPRGHRQRFLATRDHPVTLPDGSVSAPTTVPGPVPRWRKVAALKPVFRPDGTVTAGNCCPLNEGRGGRGDERRQGGELGITPHGRIVSSGVTACPRSHGTGPVEASRQALAGRDGIADIDLVEINERSPPRSSVVHRPRGGPGQANVERRRIAVGHPVA